MPPRGKSFEYELTRALNNCFREEKIRAIAYRKFNFRFVKQGFDILVDTRGIEFYLGIECKSMTIPGKGGIYFSCCSTDSKKKNQIETEDEFLTLSGRAGIMAVEVKNVETKEKAVYLVPWPSIWYAYKNGFASIPLKQIEELSKIEWRQGGYQIESDILLEANSLMPLSREANRRTVRKTTLTYAKVQSSAREKRLNK